MSMPTVGLPKTLVKPVSARTTTFSHSRRREFERELEDAREEGAGLWGACPDLDGFNP